MVRSSFEKHKILIWTKTYPELSKRYLETVCTAGVLEDGSPVRLYPIPYRYLEAQFHKYQWITAEIAKNPADQRPESYKVNCDSIECGETLPTTKDEWGKRAEHVFRKKEWQFETVDDLLASQRTQRVSLGVVIPKQIIDITIVNRSGDDAKGFVEKMQALRNQVNADRRQLDLFESAIPPQMKRLEFLSSRAKVSWLCGSSGCAGHEMQILDWEIAELQRREGDAKTLQKLRQILDLQKYAVRFFLGNLFQYPTSFTVVGLWYPQRAEGLLFR